MSALPRDRTLVRRDGALLVRAVPAARALAGVLRWPLAREGDAVSLEFAGDACILRHDAAGVSRCFSLSTTVERDAAGLTHLVADGEAEGLGHVRIAATFREHHAGHQLLYVHTNALALLQIGGGRADAPRWSNEAR